MNFLAHIFLSGEQSEVMVGNFIADSVKGSELNKFSSGVQEGIRLHRVIDTYTDNHPITLKSKERLREKYGKYSPVIVDIFYDHFLAKYWEDYSKIGLRTYADQTYKFLQKYYEIFPERSKQFFNYMVKYDILFSYSKMEGIERVMQGMSRRARFESWMETAAEALLKDYEDYKEEFRIFFPELQKRVSCEREN
ncbi:MAG: ACP phosphodiesterase [Bacteroidia bacterium]